MKSTQLFYVAVLVVIIAFLFGNFDGAIAGKSNIERSSIIGQNIFDQTGIYIDLN